MNILNIWGHTKREWGFEIRVDFIDADGVIYNEVMTFEKDPDEETLNKRIGTLQESIKPIQGLSSEPIDQKDVEISELKEKISQLTVEVAAIKEEKEALEVAVAELQADIKVEEVKP